jgi:protein SCO1/2
MVTRKAFFFVGLMVVAAALATTVLLDQADQPVELELRNGTALNTPRPIDEFELVDHNGQAFTRARLEGRWSLVFIGFTHCPGVCPMTLAILDRTASRLRADGHDLQTLFVSVDPDRDTPEVLHRYVSHFGEQIVATTGTKDQLDGFCDDLAFAYVKVPGSAGEYTVDHSAALALVDPQARVVGYFMPPLEPDALVADLGKVLESL